MSILDMLSGMGQFADDIFAMFSILGSGIMFIGALVSNSPMRRFGKIAEWSLIGLFFGVVGQVSIALTGAWPPRIGLFQLAPALVNLLLVLSFLMLVGRWFIRRNRL